MGDEATERSHDTTDSGDRCWYALRSVLPGDDRALELVDQRWVLGRADDCDLRLTQARVSRHHAEIIRRGPVISVRDLGSTNGTHVDGMRVDHQVLAPGSVLRLGEWLAVVEERRTGDVVRTFGEHAPGLWGGPVLARALRPLVLAAPSNVPVLLIGRTGSGKERFARALHDLGGTGRPFQAINCATLPPNLADAELFGYKRGAFTGAERAYAGRLYAAHGGTLFLDEIADLPLPSQAKLLRALDTGEISPLGNATPFRFEARIVSACQVPLTALVAAGKFREDLAARLSGLVVVLPEVRERRADVPALFHTFLQRHARATAPLVSTRFYERLCLHDWPGNVREIELLARRLLALHGLEPLFRRSHLPDMLRGQGSVSDPTVEAAISPKRRNARDVEKFSVALEEAGGNVRRAAAATGISRQRAYRLIGSHRLTGFVAHSREGAREDADEHDQ